MHSWILLQIILGPKTFATQMKNTVAGVCCAVKIILKDTIITYRKRTKVSSYIIGNAIIDCLIATRY